MHNPGILLKTVSKSLRNVMKQQPKNESQIQQLLETLKGRLNKVIINKLLKPF
jgi:hypothetical protein